MLLLLQTRKVLLIAIFVIAISSFIMTAHAAETTTTTWLDHAQQHQAMVEESQDQFQTVEIQAWEEQSQMLLVMNDSAPLPEEDTNPVRRSALSPASALSPQCPQFSGVFRGSASNRTMWQQEVNGLASAKITVALQAGSGRRVVDMNGRVDGSYVLFAFVFEPGTDVAFFESYTSYSDFQNDWATKSKTQGVRLRKVEAYTNPPAQGGGLVFVAYYRAGTGAYALSQETSLSTFMTRKNNFASSGLQLIDFETFLVGTVRVYMGVYLASASHHFFEVNLSLTAFLNKWTSYASSGHRLIDLDRYQAPGSTTWLYAGIFAPGQDAHTLWIGVDEENFLSQIKEQTGKTYLLAIEVNNGICKRECCNDVVAEGFAYANEYQLTNHSDVYHWPVKNAYIRLSAVYWDPAQSPNFRLPFGSTDSQVMQISGWRAIATGGAPGAYQQAIDYSQGSSTFAVRAVALGKVIFIGWDTWWGNIVIVEHSGGWRSIYMHLRNGATNDCENALTLSLPTLTNSDHDDYVAYLENSGCLAKAPQANFWGLDNETIPVTLGQNVEKSMLLGWAGNTGPRGKRGSSLDENTHLRMLFTRKDTDGNWYLVDPYGVYAYTPCYPVNVRGPLTACSRYPTAWSIGKDGKLQYSA